MKKNSNTLLASFFVLFFLGSCISRENFIVKITITDQENVNATTPNDLNSATEIITKRLNAFGIPDEKIILETSAERILLTINGIDTSKVEGLKGIVTTPGDLEFWETYENSEILYFLIDANNKLREMNLPDLAIENESSETDTLSNEEQAMIDMIDSASIAEQANYKKENPLFAVLYPRIGDKGQAIPSCLVGLVNEKDTAKVLSLLEKDEIKLLFPRDLQLFWSRKPYQYDKSGKFYELHAIKVSTFDHCPVLDGSFIVSSVAEVDKGYNDVRLKLVMNPEGARIWEAITTENLDRCIAIVLDGKVCSYPRVQTEIAGGNTEITGSFSLTEAQNLASILSSGGGILPHLSIADIQITKKK